jgi:hypothetical protein
MSHSMLGFLQHILNETQYLMDRIKGVTKTEFLGDETLKRALCHRTGIAAPTLCGLTKDCTVKTSRRRHRSRFASI